MVIQEISPHILYKPGKCNANADALSRAPLPPAGQTGLVNHLTGGTDDTDGNHTHSVVDVGDMTELEQDRFDDIHHEIAVEQRKDPKLKDIIEYIERETLPDDPQRARRIALERPRFGLLDGVLYFCETKPPYRMRMAVPECLQPLLLAEAHSGGLQATLLNGRYSKC